VLAGVRDSVLVDTSVWVDHFRRGNRVLSEMLEGARVWTHPFVIGELACGQLSRREVILESLASLPGAPPVGHLDVMAFVEDHKLMGRGIGWVDVHLLASAFQAELPLWSLDKRVSAVARYLGISAAVPDRKPPI
jgi:predicted nucleic acid-binding protein